ncbi:Panacea domain-containing protein [Ferruginivarius sediminum]|uniref:DUF4065 domain-containing protein n=1 Tax=Ferruginivarius sediminum TaxID=2661937 RepID=A0A369T7Z8_9PROT|nr:Panacea domain-containing protein [Ferruginivarius sediminum]RDD61451.1 DUF4065 domain-containing protein [Ferruginivarius sediminum]
MKFVQDIIRFPVNPDKCIQGVDLLAQRQPGITQYYVCKVFFFADREHLLDWGRPISGDRFVAMEHGPVPSFVYDLLKNCDAEPDEVVQKLNERVLIERQHNMLKVYSKGKNSFDLLSGSDVEYLEWSLKKHIHLSFGRLRELSHQDRSYKAAWEKPGLNNEMDISLWFGDNDEERGAALDELSGKANIMFSTAAE